MGYPCDLAALEALCEEHGLALVEDCAHSITAPCADGRLTGTVGVAGCFSFFSKQQLAVGEGGMVTSSDEKVAEKVRSLRSHAMTSVTWDRHLGYAESYDVVDIGFNFRIDEPRAALGLSRMPRVYDDIAGRRAQVRTYRELLADVPGVTVPWSDDEVGRSAHFGFPIMLLTAAERDRVADQLASRKIQTTSYPAITRLTGYRDHAPKPVSEDIAARHLLLPLAPSCTRSEAEFVVGELAEIVAAGS